MKMLLMVRWFVVLIFVAGAVPADAKDFDRTVEIEKYLEDITSGTKDVAAVAAKNIYYSGISDQRLASVVNERLLSDYKDLVPLKVPAILGPAGIAIRAASHNLDEEYGVWLIRALASFGISDFDATLEQIIQPPKSGGPKVKKMRQAAKQERAKLAWHMRKNDIMASMDNHHDGDDPHVSMLVNLLSADDTSYRAYAVEIISREGVADDRILALLNTQVLEYASQATSDKNRARDTLTERSIKMLGMTGDPKYRETMDAVLASDATKAVKKYAQVALQRLQ